MDACGPAKSMQTTAPSKTWRHRRNDVGNSNAGMKTSDACRSMKTGADDAGRGRRADVRNSGGVKLMKAAVESAAGNAR